MANILLAPQLRLVKVDNATGLVELLVKYTVFFEDFELEQHQDYFESVFLFSSDAGDVPPVPDVLPSGPPQQSPNYVGQFPQRRFKCSSNVELQDTHGHVRRRLEGHALTCEVTGKLAKGQLDEDKPTPFDPVGVDEIFAIVKVRPLVPAATEKKSDLLRVALGT
ncbi:MAG: hypothetical protein H6730_18795 [Deltaproteobacteria bacterium]|nr:hypothetical protein [Deltaproteobacteria bacterium]